MKPENEIKTKVLNEVIEKLKALKNTSAQAVFNMAIERCVDEVEFMLPDEPQSLLPKEEPIDWSKASDVELIEEAKRRYPSGVSIDCLFDCGVGKIDHYREPAVDYDEIWVYGVDISGNCLCCFHKGKWAEIVEEPEKTKPIGYDKLNEDQEIDQFDIKGNKPETTLDIQKKYCNDLDNPDPEKMNGTVCYYRDEEFIHVFTNGDKSWIIGEGQMFGKLVFSEEIQFEKPTPKTQEDIDMEKAEEYVSHMDGGYVNGRMYKRSTVIKAYLNGIKEERSTKTKES